ncbi:MAG: C-type lectin domain-containing protein [Myxococcales bacterium]
MRVLLANAGLVAGGLLSLGLAACGAPHNSDLFRSSGTLGESGAGNASGAAAYPNAGGAGVSAGKPEGAGGDADDSGGESSAPPNGGAGSAAGASPNGGASGGGATGGGASGGGASGGSALGGSAGSFSDCAQFGADATYFPDTQHCYLVVHELATFTAAQAHCKTLGGHLVTLANEAENDFVWGLNSEEHWIGADDGKGPNNPEPGTFSWVTNEPFTYTNWSSNQPNTSDTDCGDSGLMAHCYEHCAFQWTGGEHDGQWNDRFCLHTIAAVCELEAAK